MKHTMKQYPGDVTLESLLAGRGKDNMPGVYAIAMDTRGASTASEIG